MSLVLRVLRFVLVEIVPLALDLGTLGESSQTRRTRVGSKLLQMLSLLLSLMPSWTPFLQLELLRMTLQGLGRKSMVSFLMILVLRLRAILL